MGVTKLYLVLYNLVQTCGWTACLCQVITGLALGHDATEIYASAGTTVGLFQMLALLEIVHAATGLVPSSPVNAAMQWAGRSNVLFVIVANVQQVQSSPFLTSMLFCWSLSEVIRYPWYALTLLDRCPAFLTWLRYTVFIPIYPAGVISEMKIIMMALPMLAASGWWSLDLPNALNWAFSYRSFMVLVLGLYPILWWQLYSTLLAQRKKKLNVSSKGKSA